MVKRLIMMAINAEQDDNNKALIYVKNVNSEFTQ